MRFLSDLCARRQSGRAKPRSPSARITRRRMFMEALEPRAMLTATLIRLGSPVGTFATIQEGVDNARVNDVLEIDAGVYAESVNLSDMGSALGASSGNLIIRGTGATPASVLVDSPGGPALFNSFAFSGNLTIENIALQSASATPAADTGLDLDNYTGKLSVSNVAIQNTAGTAVDITNSSGSFGFSDLSISSAGVSDSHHGVFLQNVSGTVTLIDNDLLGVSGSGFVVENGAGTEMHLVVDGNDVFGDPNFLTTNDGVSIDASGGALIDASITGNDLFELDGSALRFNVSGNSQVQVYAGLNIVFDTNEEPAVSVGLSGAAQGAFTFQTNDVSETNGPGISVAARDASSLNLLLDNNFLTNIGDGDDGDDGFSLTSNSGSTAHINAHFVLNAVVAASGAGLRVTGVGGATYNVTAIDNTLIDLDPDTSPAAVLFEKASAGDAADFNLDIDNNLASDLDVPSFLLTQLGPGDFNLEGDAANALAQLEETNIGETFTVNGNVDLVPLGSFDNTAPVLLGGFVWEDNNGDGIRDLDEPAHLGLAVSVSGTEAGGGAAPNRSTISGRDGIYRFSAILPGDYEVEIENPLGFTLAAANQGGDDDLDSEFTRQGLVIDPLNVTLGALTSDLSLDAGLIPNYQNADNPLDTSGDLFIAPNDALVLINEMIFNGVRPLPLPAPLPQVAPFKDVNGDDFIAPDDALQVINALIAGLSGPPAEGEGEAAIVQQPEVVASPLPAAVDQFFATVEASMPVDRAGADAGEMREVEIGPRRGAESPRLVDLRPIGSGSRTREFRPADSDNEEPAIDEFTPFPDEPLLSDLAGGLYRAFGEVRAN